VAKDTISTILERRSIRKFKPEAISKADLATILEAGRQAPSASNRQPRHFVIARSPEVKTALGHAAGDQNWIATADVIIVALGLPEVTEKWQAVDTGTALHTMFLAASSLGYGACWIGRFSEEQVKEVLGIPEGPQVLALLPIGVPDVDPEPKPRKSLEELFSQERYGQALNLESL
jgi:nitroreductase